VINHLHDCGNAWLRTILVLLCLYPGLLLGQGGNGELRVQAEDPTGLGMQCSVEITSEGAQIHQVIQTNESGELIRRDLPFGVYVVRIRRSGFATYSRRVDIFSSIPIRLHIKLALETRKTHVVVRDSATLVNPEATGNVDRIGAETIAHASASVPGRSLIDLVGAQPGWVFEANGALHPRGSEYQTQFVIDGIPYTENRSPAFSPGMDAADVQSVSVITGDFPAEFGRKLGGVVEVTTKSQFQQGLHGEINVSGGSFDTAGADGAIGLVAGKNTLEFNGEGATTERYLDPPVLQNYTNQATTSAEQAQFDRQLTWRDHISFTVRHAQTGFQVPNEQVQETAGQRQDRGDYENLGTAGYEHIISENALLEVRFMSRDDSATLASNQFSTPLIASQHRDYRESYGKTTISIHHNIHDLKVGADIDYAPVHEQFAYRITDPTYFDPGTNPNFSFQGRASDREQSAFVQDLIHWDKWTVGAGGRYDHYNFLVNRSAVSPRLGVGWYWQSAGVNFHASYDRVFQTPAAENLILSSSAAVQSLSPQVLRLPVQPSTGNYWQAGLTKSIYGKAKVDVDYYRRSFQNYADDDLLLNSGVSFPIAFQKAQIYGIDSKLELPVWNRISGFISYSYMVGFGYTPVTGGLFLGTDVNAGLTSVSRFPVSQDQRNTLGARGIFQANRRLWLASGANYGSGLPTDFDGTLSNALQQYGQAIVDRVNFERGRVLPFLNVNASVGFDLHKSDTLKIDLEADGENLNNRINVIDFAGLFSGTGIGVPRSYGLRLRTTF
jgi:hypothetical protein